MSVNEGPFQAKSYARLPVSENGLVATIAAAFLIFHILAITILMQAAAGVATPPQEAARSSSYD